MFERDRNRQVSPGERPPPTLDLAAVLEVSTNPVLRALRMLRDEGLLEFLDATSPLWRVPAKSIVIAKAQELIQVACPEGYPREDLVRLIDRLA